MTSYALTSGYTHCACDGCSDITLSSDMSEPEFCLECLDNDCDMHDGCNVPEHEPDCEGN